MRPTITAEDIFGNRSRVRVLRVLRGVGVPLNTSQIARRCGITHPAASEALTYLAAMGLVDSSPAGRATVHWLVRDNAYVQSMVEPTFAAEESMPDTLAANLHGALEDVALSLVMFGSYARGDQEIGSDVDVLLVVCTDEAKRAAESLLEEYSPRFRDAFGASLSPIIYTLEEAARLSCAAPGLWASIEADGLTLVGMSPDEWSAA